MPGHFPNALDGFCSEGDHNLSPHPESWKKDHLSESTQALLKEDERHFLHQSLSTPCLNGLKSCRGAWMEDLDGRWYLDFHGNNLHQVGYGHPHVVQAIQKQLEDLPFCPRRYTNHTAVALARKLAEAAPGDLNRVLFAPGGAEAISMAIKLARVATGRFKTISMWDSFHGATLDCISLGGEQVFRKGIGPLLPGCEHTPPPEPRFCPFRCGATCNLACADYVEYILEREGDVAAVVAETVRCTPFIPPPDYWKRIRAACDRHGALLILDEIPTGLGRTGRMFAFEHFGIIPDMVVLGKGLGGGIFPLAALIARESLNVATEHALGHFTHEKNPVACAAGLATLEVLEREDLIGNASRLGAYALDRLTAMAGRRRLIRKVKGLGLLLGVELVSGTAGNGRATMEAEKVMYSALKLGLSFKVTMGDILTLTPSLVITQPELDHALAILEQAIAEVDPVEVEDFQEALDR